MYLYILCAEMIFWTNVGQLIGKVSSDGTCFMVYCDENSEIVNKTVECTTTTIQPEVRH